MNYGLLKMKSILFNSKCGDTDSGEQYGGDDSDQQKEQEHFSCVELSDMPDQPDQSQRPELHNDEKAGTAYSPEKFFVGEIPPGRNLTIRQRNQNQHDSADGDQEQNCFHQRVKFERNGMTIYFLVDPELFFTVGLAHDPFVNAVDQKYESCRCGEKNIHDVNPGGKRFYASRPAPLIS